MMEKLCDGRVFGRQKPPPATPRSETNLYLVGTVAARASLKALRDDISETNFPYYTTLRLRQRVDLFYTEREASSRQQIRLRNKLYSKASEEKYQVGKLISQSVSH